MGYLTTTALLPVLKLAIKISVARLAMGRFGQDTQHAGSGVNLDTAHSQPGIEGTLHQA
jgi:hypothetical protein